MPEGVQPEGSPETGRENVHLVDEPLSRHKMAVLRDERTTAGRAPVPPLAIVSRSLRLDRTSRAFTDAGASPTIVITCDAAGTAAIADARTRGPVIVAGSDAVDFSAALHPDRCRQFPLRK